MLSDAVNIIELHEQVVMVGAGKGGVGKSTIARTRPCGLRSSYCRGSHARTQPLAPSSRSR